MTPHQAPLLFSVECAAEVGEVVAIRLENQDKITLAREFVVGAGYQFTNAGEVSRL